MKVIMANKAGFCFGVQRAVDIAIEQTKITEEIYSYGQLIHNDQVSNMLKNKGLVEIASIKDIDNTNIIVRSHGVGAGFYDECKTQNLNIIDCTCPFVKKVHKIVDENYKTGYRIIIVGDKEHPEVIGINGWCDHNAIIINSVEEANNIAHGQYCVVAQTTLKYDLWHDITNKLKSNGDIKLYNTICSATSERQEAARILAGEVDCMIVIGGFHSSNTRKLYEICNGICENTIHIEKKSDLRVTNVNNCGIIGITAGASTPDWIIKEVYDHLIQS